MLSDNSHDEGESSSFPASTSESSTDSQSSSPTSSNSPASSGSPMLPSPLSVQDVPDSTRLGVRSREANSLKLSLDPNRATDFPNSLPMGDDKEDIATSYYVGNLGDNEIDEDDLYELTAGLGLDETGPSRIGSGKGKSYETYLQSIKECKRQALATEMSESYEAYFASPERYAMEVPSPPNNPYVPTIFPHEIDIELEDDLTEAEKKLARYEEGIISCTGLASQISSEEIMWMMEYYNLEGRWLRPRSNIRMHHFDVRGLPVPRMVLTNKLVSLGFGSPMHEFLHRIIDFYRIAPIQLLPNSYRMAVGIYLLYRNKGYAARSIEELGYFLSLR